MFYLIGTLLLALFLVLLVLLLRGLWGKAVEA